MWPHFLSMLLGLWLMASPYPLGYDEPANQSDWIVGPIVASLAAVAMWEVTRGLRWVNVLLAMWLVAAPWLFRFEMTPLVNSMVVGLALAVLSLLPTRPTERVGGGWRMLWRTT